jgi:hypothetical protein
MYVLDFPTGEITGTSYKLVFVMKLTTSWFHNFSVLVYVIVTQDKYPAF